MVDFKGKCSKCKKNTTAINPGLICASCQVSIHSDCNIPQLTMLQMKATATTDPQWTCKKCKKEGTTVKKMRTKEDLIDLSRRMDMIIEVRELLELAELALDQLQEKHDNLLKLNKFLKHENMILSGRLAYLDSGYKFKVELLQQMGQPQEGPPDKMRKSTVKPEAIEDAIKAAQAKTRASMMKRKESVKPKDEPPEEEDVTKDFTTFAKYAGLNKGERAAFKMQGKLKKLSKTWFTHLCLFICVVIYTCIGGLIFHFLEKNKDFSEVPLEKNDLVASYSSSIAGGDNDTIRNFEGAVRDRLAWEGKLERGEDELHWGFLSSVFFCGTVYTTIEAYPGYGHMSPETVLGKVAVIIYATVGVPLFLLALADFGTALTRWIKVFWNLIRRCRATGSCRKKKTDEDSPQDETKRKFQEGEDFNLPVTLALVIELIYLAIGSILFHYWEGWDFLDAFYFVFESIATIGYGDFVPKNQLYMMFSMLYILLGLAFSSMTINIVREKMVDTMNRTSAKIGHTLESYVDELTTELAKTEGLGLTEDKKKLRASTLK